MGRVDIGETSGPYVTAREQTFRRGLSGVSPDQEVARKVISLPYPVRLTIREIWNGNARDRVCHAAKQAFCFYLDRTKGFERDHDDVVNVGIAVGVLAEQLRDASADSFIGAFEAEFLRDLE